MPLLTAHELIYLLAHTLPPLFLFITALTVPLLSTRPFKLPIYIVIAYLTLHTLLKNHNTVATFTITILGFVSSRTLTLATAFLPCSHLPLHHPTSYSRVLVSLSPETGYPVYVREGYPLTKDTATRLFWVLDLVIFNARGTGWTHSVLNTYRTRDGKLYDPTFFLSPKAENGVIGDYRPRALVLRSQFLIHQLTRFGVEYLVLDIISHLCHVDAYLTGNESAHPFALPARDAARWIAILPYRLLLVAGAIYCIMDLCVTFVALVCVGFLGEGLAGSWGEYWNYPPMFGSLEAVWERGISGLWAQFWHPYFTPAFKIIAKSLFPLRTSTSISTPTSTSSTTSSTATTTILHLHYLTIFTLTAFLHASGSLTLSRGLATPLIVRPVPLHTFLFFVLQVPVMAGQQYIFPISASRSLREKKNRLFELKKTMDKGRNKERGKVMLPLPEIGEQERMPPREGNGGFGGKLAMLVTTALSCLLTMPLFVGDFVKTGAFEVDFLPFSPVGFGIWVWGKL